MKKEYRKILSPLLIPVILLAACRHTQRHAPAIAHMAESGWVGSASVYADRIPNKVVLQNDGGDSGTTSFYCLRIGIVDSTDNGDQKLESAKGKYMQLDMYKDWVLLHDGDTITPVFYQSMPKRKEKLTEQVLVFEIPKGFAPKTLVYKDPYKLLGNRQTMTLHDNTN